MRAAGAWSSAARCSSTATRIAWVGAEADLPAHDARRRRDRPRRRARHAGARRLPHPPRLRRPARRRVRAAPRRRELRGHRHAPAAASARPSRRRARRATRPCSTLARERALALMSEGVTTVEIKSGYGLAAEHEARCLRVARRLGRELPLAVQTTCLVGARAAARVRGPRRRLHRRGVRLAAGVARRRAGRRRRRLLRPHRLHRRADAARLRRGARGSACRSSCTPSS